MGGRQDRKTTENREKSSQRYILQFCVGLLSCALLMHSNYPRMEWIQFEWFVVPLSHMSSRDCRLLFDCLPSPYIRQNCPYPSPAHTHTHSLSLLVIFGLISLSLSLSLSLTHTHTLIGAPMIPFYDLNQIASIEEDDHHHSPSLPYPIFFNTSQVFQGSNIDTNLPSKQQVQLHHDQELMDHAMIQGPSNETNRQIAGVGQRSSSVDQQHESAVKWMSSKITDMKKMRRPRDQMATRKPRRSRQLLQDQEQRQESIQASSSKNNVSNVRDGIVRVCSDCNTTRTPLWRSGPSGPKSLCNACGIRQRKARRASAAAAAVVSVGLIPSAVIANKVQKSDDRTVPFKKRCRFSSAGQKKNCNYDDIVIRLSKSSAFHRVFPQDEKDAAILLMALSCGLVCS